jgi:hypothetical protein
VILYELLSGRTPHTSESGEATEVILKLFTENPTDIGKLRSDLPKGLCEAVHKSLAREREQRFEDALAMAEALAPFADARSASVLAKIRSFTGAEKIAARLSATEVFERMGGNQPPAQSVAPPAIAPVEALAATQSAPLSPSTNAALTRETPGATRPFPILPVVGIAVAGAVIIAYVIAHSSTQATTQPVPSTSTVAIPSVAPPPVSTPAPSVAPPPPSRTTVTAPPPSVTQTPTPTVSTGLGFKIKP